MNILAPGTRIVVGTHHTEIVKYLAAGGFAHIYTVKYSPIEDGNEIGVLKRVVVASKTDLAILRREVETMQVLSKSQYVVRLFDSNAQKLPNGTYEVLLLMEYCPNKSLLDFMNLHLKSKLNLDQITTIMYQICIALFEMHSRGLIHRDLKIENVLIDANGNFKLADFGSACNFIDPPKSQTEFQKIANDIIHNTTPQYRAPEMIDLYKNVPIDFKSDIWALGVFLYKLMYYTTPFEAQGELSILHGIYEFPSNPKYPSQLNNLVIIMLQVESKVRPNIYQLLFEICKIRKVPVPVEDIYKRGSFDFKGYADYQLYLQDKRQEEADAIAEHAEMKKKMYREQREKNLTPSATSDHNVNPVSILPVAANFRKDGPIPAPPKPEPEPEIEAELKPDLKQPKSTPQKRQESNDDNINVKDINNVEQRFPEVEDLQTLNKKYPTVDELSKNQFSRTSSIQKHDLSDKSPESIGLKLTHTEAWEGVPASRDIDVKGVFITEPSTVTSPTFTNQQPQVPQVPQVLQVPQTQQQIPQPLPTDQYSQYANQAVVGVDPLPTQPQLRSRNDSFYALFDDLEPDQTEALQRQQEELFLFQQKHQQGHSSDTSRNPFFSTQGANPWNQYSSTTPSNPSTNNYQQPITNQNHPIIVNNGINYDNVYEASKQIPYELKNPNSQSQNIIYNNVLPGQVAARKTNDSSSSSEQSSQVNLLNPTNNTPYHKSPVAEPTENLIDPFDLESKPMTKRPPQLNLDLLDLDVSSKNSSTASLQDNKTKYQRSNSPERPPPLPPRRRKLGKKFERKSDVIVHSIERNNTDTSDPNSLKKSFSITDSETGSNSGDLKVQELDVPKTRKLSNNSNGSAGYSRGASVGSNSGIDPISGKNVPNQRRSLELNLDLQELDLDDEISQTTKNSNSNSRPISLYDKEKSTSKVDERKTSYQYHQSGNLHVNVDERGRKISTNYNNNNDDEEDEDSSSVDDYDEDEDEDEQLNDENKNEINRKDSLKVPNDGKARRSSSLKRSSSKIRSRSISRLRKSIDETNNARKSYLGF